MTRSKYSKDFKQEAMHLAVRINRKSKQELANVMDEQDIFLGANHC